MVFHIGIEKIRLLVKEAVYWVNMNADNENTVNIVPHAWNISKDNHMRRHLIWSTMQAFGVGWC